MRILASFILGLLLFFYLSELFTTLSKRFPFIAKILPISHSLPGIIFFIAGLVLAITSHQLPLYSIAAFFMMGTGVGLVTHHLLSKQYILFEKLEKSFVHKHENGFERMLEILPGALTWIALTSPIWLSFTLPFAVAYIIIIADIYWLINSVRIAALIFTGYKRMEFAKAQNWLANLKQDFPDKWDNYCHLIVLPTYKESIQVLEPVFNAVAGSVYPKEKIFLAIGFEAWADQPQVQEIINQLEKYKTRIGGVFITIHQLQEGEVKGPGTNRNWMINNALTEFKKLKVKPKQVFVTTLDADFVLHPQFLAGALHKYLSTPADIRDQRSFTGVFLYYNNYWQTPSPMRLIATGTAFWQLAEMVGSDKYINYSSLSINMKSLLDIGLWIPNKVNDDSGFFWKAYFHYNGNYKVIPHFMPISADAVLDVNLTKTFQNQYLQLKRWAYGVEHIPFIVRKYFQSKDLDFWDKTDKLVFVIWANLKWGTLALFVSFAALLIPVVNPAYSSSVVSYNLPVIASWILTAAFLGLLSTIYVHEKTAPKRPAHWSPLKKFWSYIQWVLIPIVLVTISTIPAIDAQTSLMLGRYIEFRTTNKARTSV